MCVSVCVSVFFIILYPQSLSELGECKCVLHANVAITAEVRVGQRNLSIRTPQK